MTFVHLVNYDSKTADVDAEGEPVSGEVEPRPRPGTVQYTSKYSAVHVVSEWFLDGTSAHIRLFSALQ